MERTINDQLALRILQLIQKGCKEPSQLRQALQNEPELQPTLTDLTTKPNHILEVESTSGNYVIKGTASGAWPLNVHKFLDDHGYKSVLELENDS